MWLQLRTNSLHGGLKGLHGIDAPRLLELLIPHSFDAIRAKGVA
jgi:hypothetical protein